MFDCTSRRFRDSSDIEPVGLNIPALSTYEQITRNAIQQLNNSHADLAQRVEFLASGHVQLRDETSRLTQLVQANL